MLSEFFRVWLETHLNLNLYVELGYEDGGKWVRNIFSPPKTAADMVVRLRKDYPVHQSIARYVSESGENPIYPLVWVDIDAAEDPAVAVKEAAALVKDLKNRYGCNAVLVRTPSKGVHVWIPLKKPLKRDEYVALINKLPLTQHTDTHVKDPRKMARLPYTFKVVDGERRYSHLINTYGKPIKHNEFTWDEYEPLDPSKLGLIKVVVEPQIITITTPTIKTKNVAAPCMKRLLEDCRKGINLSHSARVALAAYLLNIGFSVDEVVEVFRAQPDFKEKTTRYQVNYIASYDDGKPLLPYSCTKMKELGMCVAECGVKNPLNHNKTHHQVELVGVRSVSSNTIESLPSELSDFLRESGLTEFTYEDFRKWLECKKPLEASEWHHWERKLRKWAEEGYLGRKFLIGNEWVDYGPGKVVKPPSKEVRFYITKPHRFLVLS